MAKRLPRALRPGDRMRIVSPASPIREDQMTAGLALLREEGYVVDFAPHAMDHDGYLAGTDADRARDLMDAFADPEVACVFCSRGGYGCARLMPHLDLDAIAASEKMFCGFSDVTTLHVALNRRGLVTYHMPMLITLSVEREPWVIESFRRLLRGDARIPDEATRAETIVPGVAKGDTVGGCMCLLCDTLATTDPLETEGKILLIEDVDENPHRVDAMFTHLRRTGHLQRAAGIVIGEMTGTDDKVDPKIGGWTWRRIVTDRLGDLGVPAVLGYPFGHMKTMLSLPLGARARLDASAGTLEFLEPVAR